MPSPGKHKNNNRLTALDAEVNAVLAELKRLGNKKTREEMFPRYGIHTEKAFGVKMGDIHGLAKRLGKNHELAGALWETGWYEARLLTSFVDEPERVTVAQMDRWCRDFDNWAICDTICFHLFDRSPHAFSKVDKWAKSRDEFVKRAAFALLACLSAHNKQASDGEFERRLRLIEYAATDDRNFVKKGVSWALRMIGRRSSKLSSASLTLAERLSRSTIPSARWVGKDALKDLAKVSGRSTKRRS